MIRVGVFGAGGRMGVTTCAAVLAAPDLELVAVVDPSHAGKPLGEVAGIGPVAGGPATAGSATAGSATAGSAAAAAAGGLTVAATADALATAGVDVAVDFTVVQAARENLRWCASNGVHVVVGTTGFTDDDLAEFAESFGSGRPANALIAANFSIGAVLMMRAAADFAPYFEGVEIIELHHEGKRDAPSGTALVTARRIEAAREDARSGELSPDPTEIAALPGTRGGATAAGVHVHSVRLPGLVAHQEVIFGSRGETLTIRHDSIDRVAFMAGVLLAVRTISERDGLTVGLDSLL